MPRRLERQRIEVRFGLLHLRLACRPFLVCLRHQGADRQLGKRHSGDEWLLRTEARIRTASTCARRRQRSRRVVARSARLDDRSEHVRVDPRYPAITLSHVGLLSMLPSTLQWPREPVTHDDWQGHRVQYHLFTYGQP